jgi:alpha-glucuronidase
MDRTVATGTGYIGQYSPVVAAMYESLETCPDELLLFMHHVPYTHVLHSGKTVIQHIYDSHYEGARDAARLVDQWKTLKGHIDDQRYEEVLQRLTFQAGHAQVWRDAICEWFHNKSGIADGQHRVGNYPNRIEAESMKMEGYESQNVTPWETASGGKCAAVTSADGKGSLQFIYAGEAGSHRFNWMYYDQRDGNSQFQLFVGNLPVDQWTADANLPDTKPSGHTAARHTTPALAWKRRLTAVSGRAWTMSRSCLPRSEIVSILM